MRDELVVKMVTGFPAPLERLNQLVAARVSAYCNTKPGELVGVQVTTADPASAGSILSLGGAKPKMKAAPRSKPLVSSSGIPATTVVPSTATLVPNHEVEVGLGLTNVATGTVGAPLESSYTWARATLVAPPRTFLAPTTIRVPEMATEYPKRSFASALGFFSVATGNVGVALAMS